MRDNCRKTHCKQCGLMHHELLHFDNNSKSSKLKQTSDFSNNNRTPNENV